MLRVFLVLLVLFFTGCFDKETPKKEDKNITKESNKTKPKPKDKNETIAIQKPIETYATVVPEAEEIQEEPNNVNVDLKNDFELYLENLKTLNTNGIIDMTYPGLFKPINKNLFIHFINAILDSPEISIENFDANITNIGDIVDYGKGKFANLEYKSIIKLNFVKQDLYSDKLSLRALRSVLQNKYGKENIVVDKDTRSIIIKKDEKLLAIKDNNSSSWKFIGDNEEYRKLYPDALPRELLELL